MGFLFASIFNCKDWNEINSSTAPFKKTQSSFISFAPAFTIYAYRFNALWLVYFTKVLLSLLPSEVQLEEILDDSGKNN